EGGRAMAGQEVESQRASRRDAERACGGDAASNGVSAGEQCLVARGVELTVPLEAVGLEVDVGEIVPDTDERRIARGGERCVHLSVDEVGCHLERCARARPRNTRKL